MNMTMIMRQSMQLMTKKIFSDGEMIHFQINIFFWTLFVSKFIFGIYLNDLLFFLFFLFALKYQSKMK